jgi:anti-sigma factor RsiW
MKRSSKNNTKQACAEWSDALHGYMDDELDAAHAIAFERHIETCAACRAELENYKSMKAVLGHQDVRWTLPPALPSRILAAIDAETQSSARTSTTKMRQPAFSLFDFVRQWSFVPSLAALAAALFLVIMPPAQESLLEGQLLTSHIRSLQVDHLTDVATSDQHTVKPWFNGKIDFSPPVIDLASQGFPLIGGRVDYVGGRTVAALVYRRHAHVINLFIWPSTKDEPLQASAHDGYNFLRWTKDGLVYWAVSDTEPDEVNQFKELFAK